MSTSETSDGPPAEKVWSRAEAAWAVGLFALAVVVVGAALARTGAATLTDAPGTALFFLLFGLFTISIGYQHPTFGHYSFDRVAQVAAVLVLGPVGATLVCGLASLLYPWHRLLKGVAAREVLLASLGNAGLMSTIVLVTGLLYEALGGQIPLTGIDGWTPLLLIGLVLLMQLLNDLGMLVWLRLGGSRLSGFFEPFAIALELGSGIAAVLVALVFNSQSVETFILLLVVMSAGMLAMRRFAQVRQRLEEIVAERTRSLEEKTRQLEQQATRDKLTGLFNRRYADDFLLKQLDYRTRDRGPCAVALGDLDWFKDINDRYSHAMGDQVLQRVAGLLTANCRDSDMIARYGGEEFLICFPNTGAGQAREICEGLRVAIAGHDWPSIGLEKPVTISFGLAEGSGRVTASGLIQAADVRLYEAKNRGRDRVVV